MCATEVPSRTQCGLPGVLGAGSSEDLVEVKVLDAIDSGPCLPALCLRAENFSHTVGRSLLQQGEEEHVT